jgi:hypothetical protein
LASQCEPIPSARFPRWTLRATSVPTGSKWMSKPRPPSFPAKKSTVAAYSGVYAWRVMPRAPVV